MKSVMFYVEKYHDEGKDPFVIAELHQDVIQLLKEVGAIVGEETNVYVSEEGHRFPVYTIYNPIGSVV